MRPEIPVNLQSTVRDLESRINVRANRALEIERELSSLTKKSSKRENIKAINQMVYSKQPLSGITYEDQLLVIELRNIKSSLRRERYQHTRLLKWVNHFSEIESARQKILVTQDQNEINNLKNQILNSAPREAKIQKTRSKDALIKELSEIVKNRREELEKTAPRAAAFRQRNNPTSPHFFDRIKNIPPRNLIASGVMAVGILVAGVWIHLNENKPDKNSIKPSGSTVSDIMKRQNAPVHTKKGPVTLSHYNDRTENLLINAAYAQNENNFSLVAYEVPISDFSTLEPDDLSVDINNTESLTPESSTPSEPSDEPQQEKVVSNIRPVGKHLERQTTPTDCGPTTLNIILHRFDPTIKTETVVIREYLRSLGLFGENTGGTLMRNVVKDKDTGEERLGGAIITYLQNEKNYEVDPLSEKYPEYGAKGEPVIPDLNEYKEALENGYLILASGNPDWVRNKQSHIFAIDAVDVVARKIRVLDPAVGEQWYPLDSADMVYSYKVKPKSLPTKSEPFNVKKVLSTTELNKVLSVVPSKSKTAAERNVPLIIQALKNEGITDPHTIAYALATVHHETAGTFLPIEEYGGRIQAKKLGYDGEDFYGRGFLQLTHKRNYLRFGQRIGLGDKLVKNPQLALDPEISARIFAAYFKDTGVVEYTKKGDFFGARKPINGVDKVNEIASLANTYLSKVNNG